MASNTIPPNSNALSATAAPFVPSSSATPANPSVPDTLVEFTIFSALPPELQDEIWTQSLPGPRLVTIAERLPGALAVLAVSPQGPTIHSLRNTLRALVRPPVALQVVRGSRAVALLHYQMMYGNVLSAPVYVDPAFDILHFYNMRVLNVFDRISTATWAHRIEHPLIRAVAIPHRHLTTTPRNSLTCTMDVIKTWHRAKDIYMVSPTENGPINGFGVDEMEMLLTLHRRLLLDRMTVRERITWTVPSVFFLREEDLEEMFR